VDVKRRVGCEPYFTPPDLAARCVALVDDLCGLGSFDLVVEPSAGKGAFLRLLPESTRVGVDIEPRVPDVERADFLGWRPVSGSGRILTVGNPPFGQRAALAMSFLHHACSFSDTVAFILPRSFNKYTFQDRVHPLFHLTGSFDCDDFHGEAGNRLTVKAVFQVWERRDRHRARVVMPDAHPDFVMRHRHLSRLAPGELERLRTEFAFTVPQVGVDFRPRDVATVTRGSHWFINPLVHGVRERFERLDFGFLDGMNTAHRSLSRRDIVTAYTALTGDVRNP